MFNETITVVFFPNKSRRNQKLLCSLYCYLVLSDRNFRGPFFAQPRNTRLTQAKNVRSNSAIAVYIWDIRE